MCCFSRSVEVSRTRIFARMGQDGRQVIAYQMQFESTAPVAMVLPLPTPPQSADDAVRFISLAGFPEMFDELSRIFQPPARNAPRGRGPQGGRLAVHAVGDFIASFVPSLADFTRLDPQFRMPAGTLDRIPAIADWGFAVFQLGATAGTAKPHPMAFEFPSRDAARLFFPTLHVHDGTVHPEATFDHALYAQGVDRLGAFKQSPYVVGPLVARRAPGILDANTKISRLELEGTHPNQDLWFTLVDGR